MRPKQLVKAAPSAKISSNFRKVSQRTGILERVRGIDIEEAAAVAAQKFDGFLRRYRPAGNRLRHIFERSGFDRWGQGLRHALRNEKESRQHADREQNVERAAGEIDPKIANRRRSSPRKDRE